MQNENFFAKMISNFFCQMEIILKNQNCLFILTSIRQLPNNKIPVSIPDIEVEHSISLVD